MIWMDVDTALSEVPVNIIALIDDTDFKTREESVVYNQAGMDLIWNFVTTAGVTTQTSVTPTTSGDYDWTNQGNGMYTIEIPASGGASINNNTEGYGWFSGFATGILPWSGPIIGFRASALNNALIDGGDTLDVNVTSISGDSTAADNLESQYDGTGLSGDNFPSTQAQVSNIANTGAALNEVASGTTVTTGTPTNSYTDTHSIDGVYHQIANVAGAIDVEYAFNIGTTGVPVSLTHVGRLFDPAPTSDTIAIQVYDWIATAWEEVGQIDGVNSSSDSPKTVILFSKHVGTGVNAGAIKLRFLGSGLGTGTTFYSDLIYVSYALVASAVGYSNGAIWIDTVNGNPGTTPYVNGTADNPVSSLADALSLTGTLNINRFQVSQGSSIQFTSTMLNYEFNGIDYSVDFNGQIMGNIVITGANTQGIALEDTGSILLIDCQVLQPTTLPPVACVRVAFNAQTTLSGAGIFVFINAVSSVAGTSAPIIDCGAASGSQEISFRNYSGGIDLRNFGASGTDTMSLEGNGQLILNANCTGGVIAIRGNFNLTDNSTGVTLSEDARFSKSSTATEIIDTVITEPVDITDKTLGGILHHLFSRFFNRVTQTATTQIVYKNDETTPLGTMTTSDDGTTQTKGEAS